MERGPAKGEVPPFDRIVIDREQNQEGDSDISDLAEDWRRLDDRIDRLSNEIAAVAQRDAGCERLMSVPGISPIISSATVVTFDRFRVA